MFKVPSFRQVMDSFVLVIAVLVIYQVATSVSRRYGGPLGRRLASVADNATGL